MWFESCRVRRVWCEGVCGESCKVWACGVSRAGCGVCGESCRACVV